MSAEDLHGKVSVNGEQIPVIERRGPLAVTKRDILHDQFAMQLVADKTVRLDDGTEGKQYWIKFPNQAVLIFPMDQDNNLYLAREFTYAANEYKLEAAGGTPRDGETFEDAAKRKVREELGVEVSGLEKLPPIYKSITSRVDNPTHVFLARFESVGQADPEMSKDIRLERIPFPIALDYVRRGIINTSVIAAAIWHINDILNNSPEPA